MMMLRRLLKKFLKGTVALLGIILVGLLLWMNFAPKTQVAKAMIRFDRFQAGMERKSIEIPGFRVAYLEGGSGEPLVLIHGSGDDKDSWTPVSKYLTRHFHVIALDLPGFGESDKRADRDYTAQKQAQYIQAFTMRLNLTSFHLGGHSLGGKIAAIYAAKNSSHVKSLWLLAPAGVYTARPSRMHTLLRQGVRVPIFGRTLEEFDELNSFVMNRPPLIPRPVKEVLKERAADDFELHNRIYQEVGEEAFQLEDIAEDLTMPTRIVWGKQDRVLDPSGAKVLDTLIPDSSVLLLGGVGHVPMIEEPRMVGEDYNQFVKTMVN
jgi:abhydrolase domain-containing protein 6